LCNTSVEDLIFVSSLRSTLHADGVPPHPPAFAFANAGSAAPAETFRQSRNPPRYGVSPRTSCGQEEIHETMVVRSSGWCAAFHHRTGLLFRTAQSCSRNGSSP